jgi:hypothetical protein
MIFLLNVKITDDRAGFGSRRLTFYRNYTADHYPTNNRVDIFKYFLSSNAVLLPLISKCVFFIEMGTDVINRKDEVEKHIKSLYPAEKLTLHWYRNNYVKDWRQVFTNEISKIDDELIWIAGNDDHIFIDNSIDTVKNGLELLQTDTNPMSFLYYSHWPEQMYVAAQLDAELATGSNYVKFKWSNFDGVMILKKERFEKYWFDPQSSHYEHELLFKPDNLLVMLNLRETMAGNAYVPTKEIVRHFDGYSHVGNFNNLMPSLVIPAGFFENNMKIKYGYDNRDNNFTNINPSADNLYSQDINGTDYRWCLNDIPLFWKNKITEIDLNSNFDETHGFMNRNNFFLKSAKFNSFTCSPYCLQNKGNLAPDIWFKNYLT